jgi:hypothetical protein
MSQRMLLRRSVFWRDWGFSSWTTLFSMAAICRASLSVASEERK